MSRTHANALVFQDCCCRRLEIFSRRVEKARRVGRSAA
jgi:hypothetical protein